jgi:CDGSH-type Zn-finger protein
MIGFMESIHQFVIPGPAAGRNPESRRLPLERQFAPQILRHSEPDSGFARRPRNDGVQGDLTMTEKGAVAGKEPIPIAVAAGRDYWWCACGKSKSQPFCDGSHKGSSFSPVKWTATESTEVYFCACKQTATQPLCSGAHEALA